jgi:Ca2+:H+ antiporter
MKASASPWFKPSLDWLLIFVPASFLIRYVPAWHNETALFIVSALAIIPIAGWMGHATEHLSHKFGEGIGGLLNASFGNAAELIIALMALRAGLHDVVKASITGSIIGNLLLVLGASLVAGGAKFSVQRFNQTAVRASCTALILAAVALLVPSVFHHAAGEHWKLSDERQLSLAISLILLVTYGAILFFSLVTHKQLFVGGEASESLDDEDNHGQPWSIGKSVGVLVVATIGVAWISEFLVSGVEAARHTLGVTEVFVGVIIVAIVGNAAEHSTAIVMAMKNKMDLALGIAVGSSLQIALFVAPVLVLASYALGPRPLDLEFSIPEVVAVMASVHIASQISGDGESNWLEGAQLLAVYLILAVLFYFLPEMHPAGH